MITIKLASYGAILEYLPAEMTLTCPQHSNIDEVLDLIKSQYPSAAELIEACACAIGDAVVSHQFKLSNDQCLVLLSPVAGG